MYSFGRKYARNPFIGRFKHEELHSGLYQTHRVLPGVIIKVPVTEKQYNQAKEMVSSFIANSHVYKYNYYGLVFGLLNRETCYDNRFLCSEFVYYILHECGVMDLGIPRSLIRPQDFYNLRDKYGGQIVYEGNLKELYPAPAEARQAHSSFYTLAMERWRNRGK